MKTTSRRLVTALAIALGLVLLFTPAAIGQVPPNGLPARVALVDFPKSKAAFDSIDYGSSTSRGDDRYARTTWRIVERTGNCCENYVTVNKEGRLFDFGGTYINFSDNRGKTWRQVQPLTPLVNGEGTIVVAPGGDILGIGWDPYSGDHLQAFKYERDTAQWLYSEMPLHQPFYDREWLSVVPGPITIGGTSHEYVALLKGATPWKELWFYSTDGINYVDMTAKAAQQILSGAESIGRIATGARAINDWAQANANTGMAQLGASNMLTVGDLTTSWYLLNGKSFEWSTYQYNAAGDLPAGRFQVDSAGRIHNVIPANDGNSFEYRISADGGLTWRATTANLPKYHSIEEWDFRANRAAGVAAVAIHAQDRFDGNDQDFVYKFKIGGNTARLVRQYTLGRGDVNSQGGVGNDIRMDFQTIGIFNDGRVVVSFIDSTTTRPARDGGQVVAPALAIEQGTALGRKVKYPPTVTPKLGTPYASYSFDQSGEGWASSGTGIWLRQPPGAAADGSDAAGGSAWTVSGPLYADSLNTSLTSPPIATQPGAAVLQFMLKLDVEPGFDYLHVDWSADGDNWLPLSDFTAQSTGYPRWQKVTLGFDSPGGNVLIRFNFTSDQLCSGVDPYCGSTWDGARVDSVIVGKQGAK